MQTSFLISGFSLNCLVFFCRHLSVSISIIMKLAHPHKTLSSGQYWVGSYSEIQVVAKCCRQLIAEMSQELKSASGQ